MKILKVLGFVVALHAIAYLVIMSPGCRSTSAGAESGSASAAVATTAAVPPAGSASSFEPGPSATDPQPISLNLPLAQTAPTGRYSPTRPGAAVEDSSTAVTPAKTYEVQKGDTLAGIARRNGLSAKELAAANNLATTATMHIGQKLVVPAKGGKPPAAPGASSGPAPAAVSSGNTYTVKSGDTLSKIAARHGTTAGAIRALNGISGDMLKIGQTLQIPGNARLPAAGGPAPLSAPAATPVAPAPAVSAPAGGGIHTVALGESAEGIAKKYKISVGELARANNITDPRKIRTGQKLVIPANASVPAAPPAPSLVPDAPAHSAAPQPGQDLDAGLPANASDAPVIKVDDPPTAPATPVR